MISEEDQVALYGIESLTVALALASLVLQGGEELVWEGFPCRGLGVDDGYCHRAQTATADERSHARDDGKPEGDGHRTGSFHAAAHVSGPIFPSGVWPIDFWNCLTTFSMTSP